jgi:hypothetical protein
LVLDSRFHGNNTQKRHVKASIAPFMRPLLVSSRRLMGHVEFTIEG